MRDACLGDSAGRSLELETDVCKCGGVLLGSARVRHLSVRTTDQGGRRSKAGWSRQDKVGPFGWCSEVFKGEAGSLDFERVTFMGSWKAHAWRMERTA